MSKEQTAPGELELVRAFVNTIDIEQGTEQLASPETRPTRAAPGGA
jgi:hypothetical protein